MPISDWRPRASSSGYYWACSQRAAFDRGISEGVVEPGIKDEDTAKPHAALGTVIHFRLQSGVRAVFPGPEKDFAPTEEEYAAAATLFGGDRDRLMEAVDASARAALVHLPKLPPGVHWLAELAVDAGPSVPPGHIDFLASDHSIGVDLKTTSRKVTRMKRAALIQTAAYALAAECNWWRVLYVDSLTASWATPIDIDFTKDEHRLMLEQLPKLVDYWRGDTLYDTAFPGPLDDTCGDNFCPYTRVCRDAIVPKAAPSKRDTLPTGGMTL